MKISDEVIKQVLAKARVKILRRIKKASVKCCLAFFVVLILIADTANNSFLTFNI